MQTWFQTNGSLIFKSFSWYLRWEMRFELHWNVLSNFRWLEKSMNLKNNKCFKWFDTQRCRNDSFQMNSSKIKSSLSQRNLMTKFNENCAKELYRRKCTATNYYDWQFNTCNYNTLVTFNDVRFCYVDEIVDDKIVDNCWKKANWQTVYTNSSTM